ncbi:MAG: hypothetical protein M3068_08885 [Gemmatimonadota bacterium]|nr:hypothetical protein [Gemmatimonadota bacterium]
MGQWLKHRLPAARTKDNREEITIMFRTILSIGALALLGIFALQFVFGVFGFLVGLMLGLLGLAIKIAIIGFVIYLVIRIVSPDTARRMRERFSGSGM